MRRYTSVVLVEQLEMAQQLVEGYGSIFKVYSAEHTTINYTTQ